MTEFNNSGNSLVPATTKFNTALRVDTIDPNGPSIERGLQVVGNVVEKSVDTTVKSADERVKTVEKYTSKLIDQEGVIAGLKVDKARLEDKQDKIVIAHHTPFGEVVRATGATVEQLRDEIRGAYEDQIKDLQDALNKSHDNTKRVKDEVRSLKTELELKGNKHSDAIAELEAKHESLLADNDLDVKLRKAELKREYQEKLDEAIDHERQEKIVAQRNLRKAEVSDYNKRRELALIYQELNQRLQKIVKTLKESRLLRIVGLHKRIESLLKDSREQFYSLPTWEYNVA